MVTETELGNYLGNYLASDSFLTLITNVDAMALFVELYSTNIVFCLNFHLWVLLEHFFSKTGKEMLSLINFLIG